MSVRPERGMSVHLWLLRSDLPMECAQGDFRNEDGSGGDRDNLADEPNESESEEERDEQPDGTHDNEQRY
jgi:hypothetical protein